MRALYAYILLFFYTLTCTGTTVYMHSCSGQAAISISQDASEQGTSCPLCTEQKQVQPKAANSCPMDDTSCCSEVKVNFTKNQEDAEQSQINFPAFSFVAPIAKIYWMLSSYTILEQPAINTLDDSPKVLVSSHPPTYLLHRNFRL